MLIIEDFRLLSSRESFFVPVGVGVGILGESLDVLHSWAIPSIGVKFDIIPGRLIFFPVFFSIGSL